MQHFSEGLDQISFVVVSNQLSIGTFCKLVVIRADLISRLFLLPSATRSEQRRTKGRCAYLPLVLGDFTSWMIRRRRYACFLTGVLCRVLVITSVLLAIVMALHFP